MLGCWLHHSNLCPSLHGLLCMSSHGVTIRLPVAGLRAHSNPVGLYQLYFAKTLFPNKVIFWGSYRREFGRWGDTIQPSTCTLAVSVKVSILIVILYHSFIRCNYLGELSKGYIGYLNCMWIYIKIKHWILKSIYLLFLRVTAGIFQNTSLSALLDTNILSYFLE